MRLTLAPEMYRTTGIVNAKLLSTKRVVVFGAGSVGSYFATTLPYPLKELILVDKKALSKQNIERHVAPLKSLGKPKVEAVKTELIEHYGLDPQSITIYNGDGKDILDKLRDVDLVVDATANSVFRKELNLACVDHGWPTIYAGVYSGGTGWEVVVLPSPRKVCYSCFRLGAPLEDSRETPTGDYGAPLVHHENIDLSAAPALAGAVAQAAGYASQMAIEILMGRKVTSQAYRPTIKPRVLFHGTGEQNYKLISVMVQVQNKLGIPQFRLTGTPRQFTLLQLCGSIPVNIQQAAGCGLH